jgi:ribosomal protein S27AE
MSEGKHLLLKRKPKRCPLCGSPKMATIQYGLPILSEKLIEDIAAQKVILGGCVIEDTSAAWQCANCGLDVFSSQ